MSTDLAWLAGILDGEGSLTLEENGKGCYSPRIQVVMADLATVNEVSRIFKSLTGEEPYRYEREPVAGSGHSPTFYARVATQEAVALVLSACLPFLRTKKEHAVGMLSFIGARRGGGTYGATERIAYERLKEANKRGFTYAGLSPFPDEPIHRVVWLHGDLLKSNNWNPNQQFKKEHHLLEMSILAQGYVQPILISQAGTIIDGFHRYLLSKSSKALREKYDGMVPCAVLDVSEAEARIVTVRMNRAKGVHAAVRMADLVQDLVDDYGMTMEQVAAEIGASLDEVRLLHQDSIFKARRLDEIPHSKAWVPREDGKRGAKEAAK